MLMLSVRRDITAAKPSPLGSLSLSLLPDMIVIEENVLNNLSPYERTLSLVAHCVSFSSDPGNPFWGGRWI